MAKASESKIEVLITKRKKNRLDIVSKILVYGWNCVIGMAKAMVRTVLFLWLVVIGMAVAVLFTLLFVFLVFYPIDTLRTIVRDITAFSIIFGITLLVIFWILIKILRLRDLCDAIGSLVAMQVGKEKTVEEIKYFQEAIRGIVYVFVVVIVFLLLGHLSIKMNLPLPESPGEIFLILMFIMVIFFILYCAR